MDILENVIAKTTPERGNELKALLFDFLHFNVIKKSPNHLGSRRKKDHGYQVRQV
jgi:hypothetical protein